MEIIKKKDPYPPSLLSLASTLNNTTDNQGDHCIEAHILSPENTDKVVRDSNRSVFFTISDCKQGE